MPGGRQIAGRDIHAALATAVPARGDLDALRAAVAPGDAFGTYEEFAAACPPERIGLSPGAHAAVFGPLFGEFE